MAVTGDLAAKARGVAATASCAAGMAAPAREVILAAFAGPAPPAG